ncbi:COP9 signalosome complex subunit [Thraustotheca clavata]|uniref:COP9 signalosome complex subunit n=1 Tax=Thraustotheca clavata TaxID=74557 RepID=A0A1W0ACK2_9STRA|nr:COP9 signalosome complex subunit [Thraustotheca clavata]
MSSDDGSEYEYEYESDYGGSQQEDGEEEMIDETAVKIENTFYEADDCKNSDPTRALQLFLQVISLQHENAKDKDHTKYQFMSLENIVKLCANLCKPDEMIQHYKEMLLLLPNVTRNECTDSINSILDVVSGLSSSIISTMYEITLEALKNANNDRLWFQTNIKLGKLYLELGDYAPLHKVLEELHASCKLPDGTDDMTKATSLLDVYCLEIQLCTATNNAAKMKTIYPKTLVLDAAISDPRIMGVIREEGGKLYLSEGQWNLAYNEFFESFRNYQEVGNARAKQCLKYVVLANMLASSDINPFDSREAKVFKDVEEINAMLLLRAAYDAKDIKQFEKILKNPKNQIISDPLMKKCARTYLEPLLRSIRSHVIQKLVGPYKCVLISNIAEEMNITSGDVELLMVELIKDGQLFYKIDQPNGVLYNCDHIMPKESSYKTLEALELWTKNLNALNSAVQSRTGSNKVSW